MLSFFTYLLPLAILCQWVMALPPAVQISPNLKVGNLASVFDHTDKYPMPNAGNITAHDPNILEHDNTFYMFKGGVHIPYYKATDLSGPWKEVGTVLSKDSIIPDRPNATRPWAPTTVEYKGKFYCFYSLSQAGSRKSAIGVASTEDITKGSWTDHGSLVVTGNDNQGSPYNVTNAIDPSFIVDQKTKTPYLNYGSYWHNLWQVELEDDLLSVKYNTNTTIEVSKKKGKNDKNNKNDNKKNQVKGIENLKATQLTFMPNRDNRPEEGSWMSFHDGYYYMWFSQGKCCDFENGFPKKGDEYHIRVGRSKNISGPFEDKDGNDLRKGGGTTVYASNHGLTYAPGGLGVLPGNGQRRDVLYYHYLDTRVGFKHAQAQLGWNYLDYDNGWPVASKNGNNDKKSGNKQATATAKATTVITKATTSTAKATQTNGSSKATATPQ
ncbi:arabinan endo-1,5-alpha-L-arabinosidase [Aspergillus chevalieri]|uniref:Arabinan endo-1,5-alpha-L-arabinosidase n=1 Tax=Aspergillus chevalieri TaxID=182096 RepID=A0A7R7VQA8_ASPCH|nr:uncharacterized protein ACHE_40712A [Aspergillus chevalieri]BCR88148.1 hypothetical protein ACHE_40712A [Aspergillus chevalieri]